MIFPLSKILKSLSMLNKREVLIEFLDDVLLACNGVKKPIN